MNAGVDDRLAAALQTVGRLTAAQAARLLATTPALAGRRLRSLTRSGLALEWHGAWWFPATPRTLERHRSLVAEVYVRLAGDARLAQFAVEAAGASVRPDVRIMWLVAGRRLRLAVEADVGTERRRQWQEKLARYAEDAPDGLLVVAPDARLRERLRLWLLDAPCPTVVGVPEDLPALLDRFAAANVAAIPPAASTPPARASRIYRFQDQALSDEEAAKLLSTGQARMGAREREAGCEIVHLIPTRRARR